MNRTVRIEKVFQHSPSTVWRALTDPEAVGEWLMKNDFQPKLGHKFQFRSAAGTGSPTAR